MTNCCTALDSFIDALEKAIAAYRAAHKHEHQPVPEPELTDYGEDGPVFIARAGYLPTLPPAHGGILDVAGYVSNG